jgi:hypothetical protein
MGNGKEVSKDTETKTTTNSIGEEKMSSNRQSRQCPACEQFVPENTRKIITKNGKHWHEGCAKEIAEAYIKLNMKSAKPEPKPKPKSKPKQKPQRTPQKKKDKKKDKNDSKTNPSA